MHGGQTFEVFSDGRIQDSRWDPVAGQSIPLSETVVPVERIRELARVWVELSPGFPHLPPFIPSQSGTIVYSLTYGEEQVHLQLPGNAYDHPTVRALREAFDRLRQQLHTGS